MHGPDKHHLRRALMAARSARAPEEIDAARQAICEVLLDRCAREGWARVAAYEPMRTEPGSVELLRGLAELGAEVLVPLVLPDNDLTWVIWRPDADGRRREAGVEAVATADAVLVPALAVAADGTRLGRGGGSYDRALARVREAPIAALVYAEEFVDQLPRDPWDQPVTAAVTPDGWHRLSRGGAE